MTSNPYAPPESRVERAPSVQPLIEGPEGLSGWLVLVGVGVVIGPLKSARDLWQLFSPIFRAETWHNLTTPGTAAYHPLWGPYVIGELVVNICIIVLGVQLAFLFFRKSPRFPRFYIGLSLASLLFVLLDALAYQLIAPLEPIFDGRTAREFTRAAISSMIWIPYMLLSRRVKNTFRYSGREEDYVRMQDR